MWSSLTAEQRKYFQYLDILMKGVTKTGKPWLQPWSDLDENLS